MAPGSALVVSFCRCDGERLSEQMRAAYVAETHNHTAADMASFLDGLDLVPPGVAPARGWQAGWEDSPGPDGPVYVLGAVGVKP